MLNKINLQTYIILSLANFGALFYFVYKKNFIYLGLFPLYLINQGALYYLITEVINSMKSKLNKVKLTLSLFLKFGSLIVIVLLMKKYYEIIITLGSIFIIQTLIFALSLKTGSKRS